MVSKQLISIRLNKERLKRKIFKEVNNKALLRMI